MSEAEWRIQPTFELSPTWVAAVQSHLEADNEQARYAAQLLWQRGIQTPAALQGFIDPNQYEPTSPWALGTEMQQAVDRLVLARERQERVAIWGDFDADGVTATAVLWDGLSEFFEPEQRLIYTIPNRFTESHGLSSRGLEQLAQQNCHLIVTCDTGSTNHAEIEQAQLLGMEVIVTDHHTLAAERPSVVALVNPRTLPPDHPLAHLSGVAVAYKLVEALYDALPTVPQRPLSRLWDLVAIGLIADLVELSGDCRYLAQVGLQQLQRNLSDRPPQRPGVAKLLELCKKTGDRPTDISYGIGPRINAVSRIHGDARFGVELLTSSDVTRSHHLAWETELANTRRKEVQRDLQRQVDAALTQIDLSTTEVVVLVGEQWPPGLLGLVAGQVARETGKPTILLTADPDLPFNMEPRLARGSARSTRNIDLYELVQHQAHLLHKFGGHPFAAGLSLPVEHIPLFTAAINQQLRQQQALGHIPPPVLTADLTVTVADLGQDLFRSLKLLEPYGMGNPQPQLFIRDVWFENVWHKNLRDSKNREVKYIRTHFQLRDDTSTEGFPGVWWGHYKDDVPSDRCDVVVELDFNTVQWSKQKTDGYEVRLIAVRPAQSRQLETKLGTIDWIIDQRQVAESPIASSEPSLGLPVGLTESRSPDFPSSDQPDSSPSDRLAAPQTLTLDHCPQSWTELQPWLTQAQQTQQTLAIAYAPPEPRSPQVQWQTLVGMAKYLSRTGQTATTADLQAKLGFSDRLFKLALHTLTQVGFQVIRGDASPTSVQIQTRPDLAQRWATPASQAQVNYLLAAIAEAQFQEQYFAQVSLATIQAQAQAALAETNAVA